MQNYLARTYGGKQALAVSIWHTARYYGGGLKRYEQVDFRRVSRIVFVCKGNICRSAYAEYRLRSIGGHAISAGLDADTGKPANDRAMQVAGRFGIDMLEHHSTHISQAELSDRDLLVAFEPSHADALNRLFISKPSIQVTLLGLWAPAPRLAYIHDPYGLCESYFATCFQRINQGVDGLWAQWRDSQKTADDKQRE